LPQTNASTVIPTIARDTACCQSILLKIVQFPRRAIANFSQRRCPFTLGSNRDSEEAQRLCARGKQARPSNPLLSSHPHALHRLKKFALGLDAGGDNQLRFLEFADVSGAD